MKYTPGQWEWGGNLLISRKTTEVVMREHVYFRAKEGDRALLAAAPLLLEAVIDCMAEIEENQCVECGNSWPGCECPNGKWWRDMTALVGALKGGGDAEE